MRGIGSILQETVEVDLADGSTVRTVVRLIDSPGPWSVLEDGQVIGAVEKRPGRRPPVAWEARSAGGDRIDGTRSRRHAVRMVVEHAHGLAASA